MLTDSANRTPLLAGIVGGAIGLLLGLFFAWLVWPLSYNPSYPPSLATTYKDDYVRMVADSYSIDQDARTAAARLRGMESELPSIVARLRAQSPDPARAARLQKLADDIKIAPAPGSPAVAADSSLLQIVLGLFLLAIGSAGLAYWFLLRRGERTAQPAPLRERDRTPAPGSGAQQPMLVTTEAPAAPDLTATAADLAEPMLGRFVTTYKLGDDGYDTSFSIETPTGDFLGECGVGISDTVGEGPQKVTAFEVWLFDKNDIKTVTKVLMSEHAYRSDTIRKKLQARGDAVLAAPGQEVLLETESLKVRAVVTDFAYGSGGAPNSFFQKLSMELAPTIKARVPA
jgi:hypothetical protein